MMDRIKKIYQEKLELIIETNPTLAENMDIDNNNITKIIIIHFILNTIKLIIIISNLSYFIGFSWYIFCDITIDIHGWYGFAARNHNSEFNDKILNEKIVWKQYLKLDFQEK
jgi:hypothetical protein